MEYELIITHFSVGQGLCVMTHLKSDGPNTFLGILDMGTLSNQQIYATDTIVAIQNAINNNSNTLDYVHISHLDSDHYNLFKHLQIAKIIKLVIGGNNTNVSIGKIFPCKPEISNIYRQNQYIPFTPQNPYASSARQIDVDVNLGNSYFFRINTLIYRADIAQNRTTDPALVINTGSSIVLVSVVKENSTIEPVMSYLFTGDSTLYTLAQFNQLINYQFNLDEGYRVILIPHHGTERNMIGPDLDTFLNQYQPHEAIVSAKCMRKNGWAHPAKAIIEIYMPIVSENEAHPFTAFEACPRNQIKIIAEDIISNIQCTFILPESCNTLDYKARKDLARKEQGNDFSGEYPNAEVYFFI